MPADLPAREGRTMVLTNAGRDPSEELEIILGEIKKMGFSLDENEHILCCCPQQISGLTPLGNGFYYRFRWGSGSLCVVRGGDSDQAVMAWEYADAESVDDEKILIPVPGEYDPFDGLAPASMALETFRRAIELERGWK